MTAMERFAEWVGPYFGLTLAVASLITIFVILGGYGLESWRARREER